MTLHIYWHSWNPQKEATNKLYIEMTQKFQELIDTTNAQAAAINELVAAYQAGVVTDAEVQPLIDATNTNLAAINAALGK